MADKKRAIYEEDLLAALRDDPHINGTNFARVKRHVNEVPTVETVEVVHGRWELCQDDGYEWYECSACRAQPLNDNVERPVLSDYCPKCGAKMD